MIVVSIVFLIAAVMFLCELRYPGRALTAVRGWWWRAALLNGAQVLIVFVAGAAWDGWMLANRPWNVDSLGPVWGALAGYLAITFVYYWWHRWRHTVPILWRIFHQIHHSASRIEIIASFYKHPLEVFANGLLSSAILYLGVGLRAEAAVGAVLLSGLAELFYHWNVRTPHWIGFVFQRPESHCLHHMRGVHFYNFSDLPMWDMLFGTFRNPKKFDGECGFRAAEERRLGQMLLGVNVLDATEWQTDDQLRRR